MTMLEKIEAVRQVQDYVDDIKDKLEIVIRHTFDPECFEVTGFKVDDGTVYARYIYSFCSGGGLASSNVDVPVAWLSEGFDYRSAYEKMTKKNGI